MIPDDSDALATLAGEYVLGLLDAAEKREVEEALPANRGLRDAVAFWENRLHPLSSLALPADPPSGSWERISARLDLGYPSTRLPSWWNEPQPWRWATAAMAAAAAVLLLFVVRTPPAPNYVAVLNAPKQQVASFIVTGGHRELLVHAVGGAVPPANRVFELWAIYPRISKPQALGVLPASGELRVAKFPAEALVGATLAVSVEPPGGSPTGLPTGPVVYIGKMAAL